MSRSLFHSSLFWSITVALLCCAATLPAVSQTLTVTGTNNLAFDRVVRPNTANVASTSGSAGQFTITGRQGRRIRITVIAINLSRTGSSLPITITNSDCTFSLDNGTTWTAFSTGTLFHEATIPNGSGNGSQGSVLVRVGGSITPGMTQTTGAYQGTVTLTATYI